MTALFDAIVPPSGRPHVVVVGDLILDEYLWGRVSRISPEAPVPVLESGTTHRTLGGAANVAQNLATLGCAVTVCGVVGDDAAGASLVELLEQRGIATQAVRRIPGRPTTHKLRVVTRGQHVLRIDHEVTEPVADAEVDAWLNTLAGLLADCDGVVLSDYRKGVLTVDVLRRIMTLAAQHGCPVAVDPKGTDYSVYRGADVLTPNRSELRAATGLPIDTQESLLAGADAVVQSSGCRAVLVTCGRDGMVLYERGGRHQRIPAEAREVYDVTGAGDTVIAVFGLAVFRGLDLGDAARLANAAAGLVVGKLGTATVERQELERYLDGHGSSSHKVLQLQALVPRLQMARAHGQRIALTNGCFDLLHAGHVRYLEAARRLADVLVVGLNSDASMRGLKGEGRPLVAAEHRAAVLAAMSCVSYVTLFDAPTPVELIEAVRPDVLVKGADYAADEVVGRELVQSYGGRVERVALVEGLSTSALIETVLARYGKEPD